MRSTATQRSICAPEPDDTIRVCDCDCDCDEQTVQATAPAWPSVGPVGAGDFGKECVRVRGACVCCPITIRLADPGAPHLPPSRRSPHSFRSWRPPLRPLPRRPPHHQRPPAHALLHHRTHRRRPRPRQIVVSVRVQPAGCSETESDTCPDAVRTKSFHYERSPSQESRALQ